MFPIHARFEDRYDAGRALAERLEPIADERPVVLGLPRGGVVVAAEVARALSAELDVLLVRKVGAEMQPELALGAVVDAGRPVTVWNEELLDLTRASPEYLERTVQSEWEEIERRRLRYREGRAAATITDRTVIVVDDGIATGATVRAALKALRQAGARRVIVAVPVAPRATVQELSREVDQVVVLETPEPFHAVGQAYRDFQQTTDEEVIELLRAAAANSGNVGAASRHS